MSPSLTDLDKNGNLKHSIDFRSVYASVLQDWFGFTETACAAVLGQSFEKLDVVGNPRPPTITDSHGDEVPGRIELAQNYPNPFRGTTTIGFSLQKSGRVRMNLYDMQGRLRKTILDERRAPGAHSVVLDASGAAKWCVPVPDRRHGASAHDDGVALIWSACRCFARALINTARNIARQPRSCCVALGCEYQVDNFSEPRCEGQLRVQPL